VWARGPIGTQECPKPLISAESLELVEKFFAWKFSAARDATQLRAKEADAFLILEKEWRTEQANGQ